MIRLFGHYVSPALLKLLGAEVLTLFGSFALGQVMWREWIAPSRDLNLVMVVTNGLIFTVMMTAILIALGVYERHFWRGLSDCCCGSALVSCSACSRWA